MLYTAAFEGQPNGAMLTHRNLVDMGTAMAWVNDVTDESAYGYSYNYRYYSREKEPGRRQVVVPKNR